MTQTQPRARTAPAVAGIVDFGRYVIPIVCEEVARRDAAAAASAHATSEELQRRAHHDAA